MHEGDLKKSQMSLVHWDGKIVNIKRARIRIDFSPLEEFYNLN